MIYIFSYFIIFNVRYFLLLLFLKLINLNRQVSDLELSRLNNLASIQQTFPNDDLKLFDKSSINPFKTVVLAKDVKQLDAFVERSAAAAAAASIQQTPSFSNHHHHHQHHHHSSSLLATNNSPISTSSFKRVNYLNKKLSSTMKVIRFSFFLY